MGLALAFQAALSTQHAKWTSTGGDGVASLRLACGSGSYSDCRQRSLPDLVVFDLDGCLWKRPRFRNGPPFSAIDDGMGGVRAASGEACDLFPAARRALLELRGEGVPVAVASNSHREAWIREMMDLIRVEGGCTVSESIKALVVRDGAKVQHLRQLIRMMRDIEPTRVLYFDDRRKDVEETASNLGIRSIHCPDGLTDETFRQGLGLFSESSEKNLQ